VEINDEEVKNLVALDNTIEEDNKTKYKSVSEAFQGIGTTVAGMASGAVSATLGLPTDVVAAGVGIKDAILADDGKRMDAFSKGFTEVSKENMGSEYYKENFSTLLDSLIDNPVLKEDAKSGFSAGEFGGVGGVVAKAPKIAKNVIAQKETAREILSSLGLSSKAMKNINVDNMSVDGAVNLAKKLKVARAKLYGTDEQGNIGNAVMAMTAKREPSPARKMTDAEKKAQGFDFEKNFDLAYVSAKGKMDFDINAMAKKFNGVAKNIENIGYFDDYPRGSKYISEPPSGIKEEFTVVGYSVSPVRKKQLQTVIDRHKKMVEYFKAPDNPEIVKRDLPEELTFFDGNHPEFSVNKEVSDQYVYRPMLIVKDKNGKTQRLNFDMILHRDQRKDELLNKVMPQSNTPKVNIVDSTKEVSPLDIGASKYALDGNLKSNYTTETVKLFDEKLKNIKTAGSSDANKLIGVGVKDGTKVGIRKNLNSRTIDGEKGVLQTIHTNNYNGKALSYQPYATVENVTFNVNQKHRQRIASKAKGLAVPEASGKFNMASVDGNYVSNRNLLKEGYETEISFNPASGHLYTDVATGQAVRSADTATVIGNRVFANGVNYWKKIDAPKPLDASDGTKLMGEVRYKFKRGGLMART